jgi:hypothetical protein
LSAQFRGDLDLDPFLGSAILIDGMEEIIKLLDFDWSWAGKTDSFIVSQALSLGFLEWGFWTKQIVYPSPTINSLRISFCKVTKGKG